MEFWKDIKGYEGLYQVSNLGKVKSLPKKITYKDVRVYNYKEKLLKNCLDSYGYSVVTLVKNTNKYQIKVHQLVACTFLNHKRCGFEKVVDHKDNNKQNNTLSNLQIITHRKNLSKDKKSKTSKYTGVHKEKNGKKFRARIIIKNKNEHLGLFKDEYEAHLAYQKALKELT